MRENQDKRFVRGIVQLRGWASRYRVDSVGAGVNESQALVTTTEPDRTEYDLFAKADYKESNVNNDHAAADRQDYSVDFDTPWSPGASGVDLDLEQVRTEPFSVRRQGRHLQVEIANLQGTLSIVSVQVDGDPGRRTLRRHGA